MEEGEFWLRRPATIRICWSCRSVWNSSLSLMLDFFFLMNAKDSLAGSVIL